MEIDNKNMEQLDLFGNPVVKKNNLREKDREKKEKKRRIFGRRTDR